MPLNPINQPKTVKSLSPELDSKLLYYSMNRGKKGATYLFKKWGWKSEKETILGFLHEDVACKRYARKLSPNSHKKWAAAE